MRRFQKKSRWYDKMHVLGSIFAFMTADKVIFMLLTYINAIFDWIRNFTRLQRYKSVDMFKNNFTQKYAIEKKLWEKTFPNKPILSIFWQFFDEQ